MTPTKKWTPKPKRPQPLPFTQTKREAFLRMVAYDRVIRRMREQGLLDSQWSQM